MVVKIKYDGKIGKIDYEDTKPVKFTIDFPSLPLNIRRKIVEYFNTKRDFIIPESQKIDDYRTERAKPADDIGYFEQSLSNLWKKEVRIA